jgi:hypothetical protein
MVFLKLCCSQNESSFKTMKFNISIYLCKVWYRKEEGKGAHLVKNNGHAPPR